MRPPLAAAAGRITGNVDRFQRIQFTPPSFVWVNAGVTPVRSGGNGGEALEHHTLHAITPETETSTHYFWATAHDLNSYDEDVMELMHAEIRTAFTEDLGVLEAQQRSIERAPEAPTIDTPADAGGLEATRIIDRLLEAESGAEAVAGQAPPGFDQTEPSVPPPVRRCTMPPRDGRRCGPR